MNIDEEYDRLLLRQQDLNTKINNLTAEISTPCKHKIRYAHLDPFICNKCTVDFFMYLLDTNVSTLVWDRYRQKFEKQNLISSGAIYNEIALIQKNREAQKQKDDEIARARRWFDEQAARYGNDLARYIHPGHNLSSEELGKRYERYIGYLYEIEGYSVTYHGIRKGVEDEGVDIIAENKKEVAIVQCKRCGKDNKVRYKAISVLHSEVVSRAEKNKKDTHGVLYTSNDNLDEMSQKKIIEKSIKHFIVPYPFDIKQEYPLIKCNISGKNKEKIYHLPVDGSYDQIKIEIHKGEFYTHTPKEAEALGFRRAKN